MKPKTDELRTGMLPKLRLWPAFHIVLVLSVILQSVVTMPALAYQAGQVIEICAEIGVSKIRIDAEGNEIPSGDEPFPNCGDCPLCLTGSDVGLPSELPLHRSPRFSLLRHSSQTASEIRNPAQFWADNRGPPARTEKANHLAMKNVTGPARIEGRAP